MSRVCAPRPEGRFGDTPSTIDVCLARVADRPLRGRSIDTAAIEQLWNPLANSDDTGQAGRRGHSGGAGTIHGAPTGSHPVVDVRPDDVRSALRTAGIARRAVCAHSSLASFGRLAGGADALAQAFVDEGCTLLVPTFSWSYAIDPPDDLRPPQNGWEYHVPAGAGGSRSIRCPKQSTPTWATGEGGGGSP